MSAVDVEAQLDRLLEEDPADLYENAPMGYLSTLPDGRIVKVNRTFCTWAGRPAAELVGTRFQDLLTVGGRVYHETHLVPLLRMQGAVREIALDVERRDGPPLPCLLNAVEVRDDEGRPLLVRATVFEATDRRRYERELLAAQRAAEEAEARSRTVQWVVQDLAAATSVADVAAVMVARGAAALAAAGAALLLVEEDDDGGRALRVGAADGVPGPLLDALRTVAAGRLALELAEGVRVLPVDAAMRATRPEVAAACDAAGLTDLVLVPVAADGRRLGVLLLVLGGPPVDGLISLDEPGHAGSLPPAEVDLLWTLGRQTGQAVERARLYEQTARQAERATFLLDAARLLASSTGVAETVERVAELAVRRLADVCIVDLASEQGVVRAVARHRDLGRQELLDEIAERNLPSRGVPHPSAEALREGVTRWLRHVDDDLLVRVAAGDHRHLELLRRLAVTGLIAVPLTGEGRRLGVATLLSTQGGTTFSAEDVHTVEQLALQVSMALVKAQRYEVEEHTSHTLQASMLPSWPPEVPGLAIAVRYLAATQGVEVGGDFHDVVRRPDGHVDLAVGDVVGHDITAAATMGQLTSVYRALLADRPAPGALIDRLQAGWSLLRLQRMSTALFGSLDPATGQLRLASAGHLPPLLLHEGRARFLPVQPSRMLGAPPAPAPAPEWAGVLPAGATLLLYTDGLVESRTADVDEGMQLLLEAAERAATADPDELCDRLLAELTGSHRADDIALLALTRLP